MVDNEKPTDHELAMLAKLWFHNEGLFSIVGLLRLNGCEVRFEIERVLRKT
jgi:hypothetical protein